jgi:hypothetical protein
MQDIFRSFSTVKDASSALDDTSKSGLLNNITQITM